MLVYKTLLQKYCKIISKNKGERFVINFKVTKGIALLSAPLLLAACGEQEEEADNVGEAMEYTMTGVEPGSGVAIVAREVLEEYDNLEGWEIEESSTAGMITLLDEAVENEEPIVVTAWTPHYTFAMHDLKVLEDPQNAFGDEENINTLTRLGLEEDMPEAYEILDNFYWEPEEMEEVMLEAQERPFEEVSLEWIENNRDRVDEWTEGVDEVDGEEIELGSIPWDTERSSANVIGAVLEEQGYDVTITNVDEAVLFQALMQNEVDATVAAWLPVTHGAFLDEYGEGIVDLGPNLEDTVIGFVVPEYMEDINSIDDLPAVDE